MPTLANITGGWELSQREIVTAMLDPGFYSPRPASVELRETHTSYVFLAGDRAYKVKKAVRFDFLDYSNLHTRRRMCEQEVELNRRLAPKIYRGVRAIVRRSDGFGLAAPDERGAKEFAVEMRRFDESRTLAARVARHAAGSRDIQQVAERIACFHAAAPVIREDDPRHSIKRTTGETFTTMFRLVPLGVEAGVTAAARFTDAFLTRRGDQFLDRAAAGFVRDGHGDLRAEHVVLQDPIQIVDCVEFDPGLRRTDVAFDLAFLVMDLHRLGAAALAGELVQAYRASGGDPGDDALLSFYAAQRAWVRAKIELIRAEQLHGEDGRLEDRSEAADRLLELGRRFAWRARQPLLLVVCGLSGSGKSYLAQALAANSGFTVIGSDVTRKQLAVSSRERGPLYSLEFNELTYAELGRLAAAELERSGGVIVDATFRQAADRRAFSQASGEASSAARFVECLTPLELRLRRVERRSRQSDPSDATPAIAAAQVFEELAEVPAANHLALRTDRLVDSSIADLERWLDSPVR